MARTGTVQLNDYVTVAVKGAGFLQGSDLTWEGFVREIRPAPQGISGRLLMVVKPGGFEPCGFHEKWCTVVDAPDPKADRRHWERESYRQLQLLTRRVYGDAIDRPVSRSLSERERVVFAVLKRVLDWDGEDPEETLRALEDIAEGVESKLGLLELDDSVFVR